MTRRIAAAIQIVIIVLVISFGTWQLYKGNFEASMLTVPFLIAYYLVFTVRHRKLQESQNQENDQRIDDHGR